MMLDKFIFKFWPIITIIFIVGIFFYPVWLQNKVPIPADLLVGAYYPWLDYKWGYEVGVPVKNPITSDVISFFYPMKNLVADFLINGKIPLWNPYILSGTPLLANFQSAALLPLNLLFFIFDKLTSWTLQVAIQPVLAAVALYFLLREFKLSKLAAITGGLSFAFGGFITIWMQWVGHAMVAAFFPIVFLFCQKWISSGKIIYGILLSIALALQILSGYPQLIFYEFLGLIILVIINRIFIKRIIFLILFLGLGVGLSGFQVLPGLELSNLSQRGIESINKEETFIPWQALVMIFAPDFFGNHSTYNYWGPSHYTIASGYTGIIVIILSLIGLFRQIKSKLTVLGLGLLVITLLLGFENPLSLKIYESGWLNLQAASAHRMLILINLGLAILASLGIDSLLGGKLKLRQIVISISVPFAVLLALALFSFLGLRFNFFNLTTQFQVGLRNLITPLLFLVSAALFILLAFRSKKYVFHFTILVFILSIVELIKFGWKYTPFSPRELIFPKTPVIEFLQNQKNTSPPFRVVGEGVIPMNFLMPYGLETIEGYDALYPLQYATFLSALNTDRIDTAPMGRYGSVKNINSNLINLANGRFILVLKEDENVNLEQFIKVFEDQTVVVLENKKVLPRAFLAYDWEIEPDDKIILSKLVDHSFPIRDKIFLNEAVDIAKVAGNSNLDFSKYDSQKILSVYTSTPGILFIADSWYPGWKAFVNDNEVKLYKSNFNFMAIPIEKVGNFKVKLDYQPDTFKHGLMVSCLSFLILSILLFGKFIYDKFKILK